jgi:hypothetical protein
MLHTHCYDDGVEEFNKYLTIVALEVYRYVKWSVYASYSAKYLNSADAIFTTAVYRAATPSFA